MHEWVRFSREKILRGAQILHGQVDHVGIKVERAGKHDSRFEDLPDEREGFQP